MRDNPEVQAVEGRRTWLVHWFGWRPSEQSGGL